VCNARLDNGWVVVWWSNPWALQVSSRQRVVCRHPLLRGKENGLCREHRAHGKLTVSCSDSYEKNTCMKKPWRQSASSLYRKNYIAGNAISRHTIQISTIYHYSPLYLACSYYLLLDVWLLYLQLVEQKSNKDIVTSCMIDALYSSVFRCLIKKHFQFATSVRGRIIIYLRMGSSLSSCWWKKQRVFMARVCLLEKDHLGICWFGARPYSEAWNQTLATVWARGPDKEQRMLLP
jgi:hypothetical protein